jgi:hypothetical protein
MHTPKPLAVLEVEPFELYYDLRSWFERSQSLQWMAERDDGDIEITSENIRATILGVTAKAVSDYVRYKGSSDGRMRRWAKDAERWLFQNGVAPEKEPFLGSFSWVCMILDKDLGKAREIIRTMKVSDLPKVDRHKDDG